MDTELKMERQATETELTRYDERRRLAQAAALHS